MIDGVASCLPCFWILKLISKHEINSIQFLVLPQSLNNNLLIFNDWVIQTLNSINSISFYLFTHTLSNQKIDSVLIFISLPTYNNHKGKRPLSIPVREIVESELSHSKYFIHLPIPFAKRRITLQFLPEGRGEEGAYSAMIYS